MDDPIRDRRRSVFRRAGRKRGTLALVAVVLVLAGLSFIWLRSSDVFAVKRISVSATDCVSSEQIATATASALGKSLLSLSTKPIKDALKELPYVRSVEVYRDFPNTLEVHLEEYRPVARLRTGDGGEWLVSEDGRALGPADASAKTSLPLVVPATPVALAAGDQLPKEIAEALPLVTLLSTGRGTAGGQGDLPAVKEVDVSAGGEVALSLAGGLQLRMGAPTDLEHKLTVAAAIIQQCLRDEKKVAYVDVSVPGRVAVRAK